MTAIYTYVIVAAVTLTLTGNTSAQHSAIHSPMETINKTPNNWTWKSPYSVKETMNRLLNIISRHPEVLQYSRIDQQAVAKISGKEIRPVESVFFQNSTLVGKILQANIQAAVQLPIKATVWKDENNQVWIQTTDIDYLNTHYQLNGADGAIDAIHQLLPEWINETIKK